jgi:Raf kinase inhibitor-like YbhB/YbcL family protein
MKHDHNLVLALTFVVSAVVACTPAEPTVTETPPAQLETAPAPDDTAAASNPAEEPLLGLTSPAFTEGGSIPSKYTCDESDTIPPLTFTNVPGNAKSLALVMDDPDVPPPGSGNVWVHWVVWNIPPDTRGVREDQNPPGVTGLNGWARNDYGGPCPPDREHRYYFRLYALDTTVDLPRSADRKALDDAIEGHIVGQAELMGRYVREH